LRKRTFSNNHRAETRGENNRQNVTHHTESVPAFSQLERSRRRTDRRRTRRWPECRTTTPLYASSCPFNITTYIGTDFQTAAGAKIIFGDVDDTLATKLASTLNSKDTPASARVHFVHCDTSNYANQLTLFQTAYKLYNRIDIVIANAAIAIHKDPFIPAHESDESILSAPNLAEIDVNLKGPLYTARLGLHYLRKNATSPSGHKGDIVLVSSIAGFKECEGLTTYTASKHGVIGLMRGLALQGEKEKIRINTVCPWMTSTSPRRKKKRKKKKKKKKRA
jgi:NAD(P)-dependent dehydrogenase (short-subunit alcohol dehydrogenase family)